MKKKEIVFTSTVVILTIVGCLFTYQKFEKETAHKSIDTNPIFSLEDYPKVDASTVTQPLAIEFIRNFTGEEINIDDLNFTKTHQAYEKLILGEVDLILVTQPSKEELELAKQSGVELEVTPLVNEGFVFFVNQKNKVSNLTTEQIQKIYTGEINNWKEVGGSDKNIIAYQRPINSGSQTGMLELVMKGKKMDTPPTENVVKTMSEILNLVSNYNNTEEAIGYSYYYYATTMYQDIDSKVTNNIKLLNIDGIEPNSSTIKAETYPFHTSYYIVINKKTKKDSNTRKLKKAMLSSRGKEVATKVHYVSAP